MIISYNWLQTYFKKKLPVPEKVAELLTFHIFEIESVAKTFSPKENVRPTESVEQIQFRKKEGGDAIFDVKVLPDRAHYALSHRGVAMELGAILDQKIQILEHTKFKTTKVSDLKIEIKNPELCPRYIGRRIENLKVDESPAWLRERLESIGQRSINSIVDVTNFIMLDINQPLHAFDADVVKGTIQIRLVEKGEKIRILDGKDIELAPTMLVIADDVGPLAIAGVKGGVRAQVTEKTKNIILESANFNPTSIRKTSQLMGVRNDSSKRFENGISPELAAQGMEEVTALIASLNREAKIGEMIDIYPYPTSRRSLDVELAKITEILGVEISSKEFECILFSLDIPYKLKAKRPDFVYKIEDPRFGEPNRDYTLSIPLIRNDLAIPEDIAEEVGRLYGYEKIKGVLPKKEKVSSINKNFYYTEKIKTVLASLGFSEIYTPTIVDNGDVEIENPLASDKKALRNNLAANMKKSLELNVRNAPLLGLDQVKIFEIGQIFGGKTGERTSLCVAVANAKGFKRTKVNEEIKKVRDELFQKIGAQVGVVCTIDDTGGLLLIDGKQIGVTNYNDGILELDLEVLLAKLPEPAKRESDFPKSSDAKYQKISLYPFVLRDIAVWTSTPESEVTLRKVLDIIAKNSGGLLVQKRLIDTFTRRGKTSYAFSLVFQSSERTLSDTEVNVIMEKITKALNKKEGWQVR